jgi:hypothetical protein
MSDYDCIKETSKAPIPAKVDNTKILRPKQLWTSKKSVALKEAMPPVVCTAPIALTLDRVSPVSA